MAEGVVLLFFIWVGEGGVGFVDFFEVGGGVGVVGIFVWVELGGEGFEGFANGVLRSVFVDA